MTFEKGDVVMVKRPHKLGYDHNLKAGTLAEILESHGWSYTVKGESNSGATIIQIVHSSEIHLPQLDTKIGQLY